MPSSTSRAIAFGAVAGEGREGRSRRRLPAELSAIPHRVLRYFEARRGPCSREPAVARFELAYELNDTQAEVIIALDQLIPVVEQVRSEMSSREIFVTSFAEVLRNSRRFPRRIPSARRAVSASQTRPISCPRSPRCQSLPLPGLDSMRSPHSTTPAARPACPRAASIPIGDMIYTAAAITASR